jgi:hypothetical protein
MRRKRNRGRRGERSSLKQLCDRLAATAQATKARMCEHCNGPVEGSPALVFRLDGNEQLFVAPLPHGHPIDTLPPVLEHILEEGHPDFLALVTESYIGPTIYEHTYQRGQLERDFKKNPTSDVKESLLIAAVDTRHGRHRSTAIPFVYDDGGMPRFTRLPWSDDCDGNLGELLADCVRHVQRRAGW